MTRDGLLLGDFDVSGKQKGDPRIHFSRYGGDEIRIEFDHGKTRTSFLISHKAARLVAECLGHLLSSEPVPAGWPEGAGEPK